MSFWEATTSPESVLIVIIPIGTDSGLSRNNRVKRVYKEMKKYNLNFDISFKQNPYKGKFFALEGIDGSGKTTQAELVAEKLRKQGQAIIVKNPFSGEIGQFVRDILFEKERVTPVTIQYLLSANRAIQQDELIAHLKKGEIVLIDRYFWTAVVYGIIDQGSDFANADMWLTSLSALSMYNQFIVPDKTFYLDISVDTAMRRLSNMERKLDLYENRTKLEKIKQGFDWIVKKFPEEFITVDGEKGIEEVTESILSKLPK